MVHRCAIGRYLSFSRYEVVLRPKRSPSKRARNPEEFVLDYVDPSNPVPDDEKDEDE